MKRVTTKTAVSIGGLVILLFLAFGSTLTEEDKEKAAKEVSRALKPGQVKELTQQHYDDLLRKEVHQGKTPNKEFYRVSGIVLRRTIEKTDDSSKMELVLKPWNDSRVEVVCIFDQSQEPTIIVIPIGSNVTVAGKFHDFSEREPSLIGCHLLP